MSSIVSDGVDPPDRPDLYVLARFLDALRSPERELNRSKLQAATRVNYDIFRSYLALLEEKGWIWYEERPGRGQDRIKLTRAGFDAHEELVGWIRRALGNGRL